MHARDLSPSLRDLANARWKDFSSAAGKAGVAVDLTVDERESLLAVWGCSEFVAQSCIREPALLKDLLASGDLSSRYPHDRYAEQLARALDAAEDEAGLMSGLRTVRRREMVRIAWRDLAGSANLEDTVHDLSNFADAALDAALGRLHRWQAASWGEPMDGEGRPQSMTIIAMGKLGASELNFSSDIDLIFAIPQDGCTVGGRRQRTSQEFFVRLGQRLIHVLNTKTPDGMVFRVDMRLRPFGASGPLVMTFDAMEAYYQTHGREWERYALIKARAVAGDPVRGEALLQRLQPFVFRRYLDFGAFESLREMKALIGQEVMRKGLENDVKLGRGGIREVEFIVQAFQLIRGGREPALRDRRLLSTLKQLAVRGYLPEQAARDLEHAYRFLRTTEHRLQEVDDRQTQALPGTAEGRARLAFGMGFNAWNDFEAALNTCREQVQKHFEQVFATPDEEVTESKLMADLRAVWLELVPAEQAANLFTQAGFEDGGAALKALETLRATYSVRVMGREGRSRLDRLMPLLLSAVGHSEHPTAALERVVRLVEAVARRSVYLALLVEYPVALSQLVRLCGASPWIAAHLTRYPLLLDELLDPRSLYAPPDQVRLAEDLDVQLRKVPAEDMEQEMEALRVFKQANVLRVAAADSAEAIPLMVVSDHLTWIAEVIVRQALSLAWRDLTARYGVPRCRVDGETVDAGFIIIAYGKLGGIELGYGSDLDLVFLHGSRGERQHTDGAKSIDNGVFFGRLGQRLIHLMTSSTGAGTLYEIDARLRPSGASGLFVSNMDAFEEYQRGQAWTWEHQALVRARVVAGDEALALRFQRVRQAVLGRQRDSVELRTEVREMRAKMRAQLSKSREGFFDLKQDAGGIADIEFMVQYGVLLWTHKHPAVLEWTDNMRLLETFAAEGLLSQEEATLLGDAYRAYRAEVHKCALQEQDAVVAGDRFAELRQQVSAVWDRLIGD